MRDTGRDLRKSTLLFHRFSMDFLQAIAWRPRIGDPSVMGWVTVVAYALAAISALAAARRAQRASVPSTEYGGAWLLVAVLMALLSLNKQLDLQSLLTDVGRVMARRQGWYENRREIQQWLLVGIAGGSIVCSAIIAIRFHRFWRTHVLLGAGLVFLATFIAVRAISFHHFDVLLGTTWVGVRANWLLEIGGIALVLFAALRSSPSSAGK
jgi:hypothetical protein